VNFYPFHIGDYLSHTSHLTDEEDLAYRRMIDLYYQTEEPFTDTAKLARKVRSSFEIVGSLLHEFFVQEDGAWHNKRADVEIAKYKAMKDGGRKGAALRWHKGSDSPPITPPNHSLMQTKNQEPLTKNHIKTTPKVVTPEGVSDDLWNDFLIYRKRLKAPVTDRVLARLIKEAELAKMPLDQVLETIIFKGWRSFDATWITQAAQKASEMPLGSDQQIEEAYRVECGGDPRLARFNSYFEMKKFILDQRDKKRKVA
jgi:uncharacterized protein YdaU (DUF1376 family)